MSKAIAEIAMGRVCYLDTKPTDNRFYVRLEITKPTEY